MNSFGRLAALSITAISIFALASFSLGQEPDSDTYVIFDHVDGSNYGNRGIRVANVNVSEAPVRISNYELSGWFLNSPDNESIYYTSSQGITRLFLNGNDEVVINYPNVRIDPGTYVVSPNAQSVVLRASTMIGDPDLLIAVASESGTGTVLYEGFQIGSFFAITPDSNHVIFQDRNERGITNLFVISITGGEALQLNPRLAAGGNVLGFSISQTGEEVVYLADQNFDEVYEYFAVPVQGGQATALSTGIDLRDNYTSKRWQITPDGQHLLFNGYLSGRRHLYSVPISGGTPILIGEDIGTPVWRFHITSDSRRVVFVGNNGYLYSSLVTGEDMILIAQVDHIESFIITPDDSNIIYMSALPSFSHEISIVDIMGGEPSRLTPENLELFTRMLPRDSGEKVWSIPVAAISSDGHYLAFAAQDQNGIPGIYSVPSDGGEVVQLNDRPGSRNFEPYLMITADSQRVVYVLDQEFVHARDIYSVPIQGGTVTRLTTDDTAVSSSFRSVREMMTMVPLGNTWLPSVCDEFAYPNC